MSALRRSSLRTRLALALAGVAVASVALATILSNDGLQNELARSSRQRLAGTARHLAELAAELYAREGGFTAAARGTNRGVAAA